MKIVKILHDVHGTYVLCLTDLDYGHSFNNNILWLLWWFLGTEIFINKYLLKLYRKINKTRLWYTNTSKLKDLS